MGNRMWALVLRCGLPEEPPSGDVPPSVLRLERRDGERDEPPVVVVTTNAVPEEVAVKRAA